MLRSITNFILLLIIFVVEIPLSFISCLAFYANDGYSVGGGDGPVILWLIIILPVILIKDLSIFILSLIGSIKVWAKHENRKKVYIILMSIVHGFNIMSLFIYALPLFFNFYAWTHEWNLWLLLFIFPMIIMVGITIFFTYTDKMYKLTQKKEENVNEKV